jgi:hypothetical protein
MQGQRPEAVQPLHERSEHDNDNRNRQNLTGPVASARAQENEGTSKYVEA